jgi:hypothetical protein
VKKRTQIDATNSAPTGCAVKRKPGELEIRIRPDGRVFIAEADEAMLDVCEALDPDNPVVVKRKKGRSRNES